MFKQPKHSHWNIKCGNINYIYRSSHEHSLGRRSLTRASVSGMATVLTEKYQKKVAKVTKLADIVTSALAVFERSVSEMLNSDEIDEQEFGILQTLHSKSMNEVTSVDHKMEAENRNQF